MDRPYTTQELVDILAQEHQACIKGERLDLNATISGNPLLDQLINPEGAQSFAAYQGFRRTIHSYQRREQISGLLWHTIELNQERLTFPKLHEHLIALPRDIQQLRNYLKPVCQFWKRAMASMDLYLECDRGRAHQLITMGDMEPLIRSKQWATLRKHERAQFLEVVLELGWGDPSQALHRQGWPDSGVDYIHGVRPGSKPIA